MPKNISVFLDYFQIKFFHRLISNMIRRIISMFKISKKKIKDSVRLFYSTTVLFKYSFKRAVYKSSVFCGLLDVCVGLSCSLYVIS